MNDIPAKKILIIDDEETIVRLCRRVLDAEGYQTRGASCGEEALSLADQESFQLVVTDMMMPGMDGMETFLALQAKQPGMIGVMITAHGTVDTAIHAMGRGMSSFIRKPFMPRELVLAVKDVFHRSAIQEENTRLKSLLPLYELGERFSLSRSKEEVLDGLIATLSLQTGAQRLSVMLYDEEEDILRMVSAMGIEKDIIQKVRIKPGEKITGQVFKEGNPLIINGGPCDNPGLSSFLASNDIVAAIVFPLKARDKTIGVLNISKIGRGAPFSESDIEMVSILCRQAVMALGNLKAMDERLDKIRVRTLLEQYLAPEVTEILLSRGQDLLDVGEIKKVAILFADIRNFTPLVRQIPLKTIRLFLNDFFGQFSEIIFRFKGTMDKFLGDAVLAFFGAPVPVAELEQTAVDAAIMMHKVFDELKEAWALENEALRQIGLGIGISSGEVFLGNIGSKRRLNYTVIGIEVNIAERLSSKATSGEILVTEPIRDKLGSRFRVIKESSYLLKGMEDSIPVFSIKKVYNDGKAREYGSLSK